MQHYFNDLIVYGYYTQRFSFCFQKLQYLQQNSTSLVFLLPNRGLDWGVAAISLQRKADSSVAPFFSFEAINNRLASLQNVPI